MDGGLCERAQMGGGKQKTVNLIYIKLKNRKEKRMKKLSLALLALLAFSFVGCEGWLDIPDDPEPDPEPEPIEEALINLITTEATLHYGETFQIEAECENPITYTSEDEYYAMVSEDGLVTAGFVGSTSIMLETEGDSQVFEVTIEPTIDLYAEPEVEFGETRDDIVERFGTPDEEDEEAALYGSYADNAMLMVVFDEEGLVSYYAVIISTDLENDLNAFLGERYMFYGEEDGLKIYINALDVADCTLIVGTQYVDENYLMALYMPHEGDDGGEGGEGEGKGSRVLRILRGFGK